MTRSVQVLIVGAGPVGLSLALELQRQGVEALVLEKRRQPVPPTESRALGVHSRTLEAFERMGVIEEVLAQGRRVNNAVIWRDSRSESARIDLSKLDTPFPFLLLLEQGRTEAILTRRVQESGVAVERGVELIGFRQEGRGGTRPGVRAVVRSAGGALEEIFADFLVGCDGAHSTVRSILNIPFDGHAMPGRFALADARARWRRPYEDDAMNLFLSPELIFGRIHDDYWRFVVELPEDIAQSDAALSEEDIVRAVKGQMARHGVEAELTDTLWSSDYRVSSRMVNDFRSGRVFLAGDAAHIHSPVSGQGMNGGVQDAVNLGWKLALSLQNRGGEAMLDSYNTERRAALKKTLKMTAQMAAAVNMTQPIGIAARDAGLRLFGGVSAVQRGMRNSFTGQSLNYRTSPIVGEKGRGHGVRAGERAPDARVGSPHGPRLYELWGGDPRHRLLVLPGTASSSRRAELTHGADIFAGRLGRFVTVGAVGDVIVDASGSVAEAYGTPDEALYLIRPDGYVAFRAQPADFEALTEYAATVFREGGAEMAAEVIHPDSTSLLTAETSLTAGGAK